MSHQQRLCCFIFLLALFFCTPVAVSGDAITVPSTVVKYAPNSNLTEALFEADRQITEMKEKISNLERNVAFLTVELQAKEDEKRSYQQNKDNEIQTLRADKENLERAKQEMEANYMKGLSESLKLFNEKQDELKQAQLAAESDRLKNDEQMRDLEAKLENTQKMLKLLNETLLAAEEVMKNPALFNWFENKVGATMEQMPALAGPLNDTLLFLASAAKTTYEGIHGSVEGRLRPYTRHATWISELIAYLTIGIPVAAFLYLLCTRRIRIGVNHLCMFSNTFFMLATFLLFLYALSLGRGHTDPLEELNADKGKSLYVVASVLFVGGFLMHLLALLKFRDAPCLFQLFLLSFIGSHYYTRVLRWVFKNEPNRLRSRMWYLIYAVLFMALMSMTFQRLNIHQQSELRNLLSDPVRPITSVLTTSTTQEDEVTRRGDRGLQRRPSNGQLSLSIAIGGSSGDSKDQ